MLGGAVVAEEVTDLQDRGKAARDEDDSEPILLLMDPVHDHLGHVSRGLVEDETDVLAGVHLFVREDDVLEVAQGDELVEPVLVLEVDVRGLHGAVVAIDAIELIPGLRIIENHAEGRSIHYVAAVHPYFL